MSYTFVEVMRKVVISHLNIGYSMEYLVLDVIANISKAAKYILIIITTETTIQDHSF